LGASDLSESDRERVIDSLSKLQQGEIAQSREIEKASVKPRLRLMAEVHEDGNVNHYPEILPRTANLVIKQEAGYDLQWLVAEFAKEGFRARVRKQGAEQWLSVATPNGELDFKVFSLQHKRNGLHLVLQLGL
jgi:hypothetical protein